MDASHSSETLRPTCVLRHEDRGTDTGVIFSATAPIQHAGGAWPVVVCVGGGLTYLLCNYLVGWHSKKVVLYSWKRK